MLITHKIRMALDRIGVPETIASVQGNKNTQAVEITLTCGNKPWEVPAGVHAMVRFGKPDGTGGIYDTLEDGTAAITVAGNKVTALLAPQVLTVPGCVRAQVELTTGTKTLSTFTFIILVEPDHSIGTMDSEDYINLSAYVSAEVERILLDHGGSGLPGESGGYYVPAVSKVDEKTMKVSFTPSNDSMAVIEDQYISLPVGPSGADGKSAYAYAQDGGYTGTEEEFAEKLATGGAGIFWVHATLNYETGTAEVEESAEEIYAAYKAKMDCRMLAHVMKPIIRDQVLVLQMADKGTDSIGETYYRSVFHQTSSNYDKSEETGEWKTYAMLDEVVVSYFNATIQNTCSRTMLLTDEGKAEMQASIPDKLPNPNALTIDGVTYDGSAAVSVDTTPFIITITGDDESGYTADKTAAEIRAAYSANRRMVCNIDGVASDIPLAKVTSGVIQSVEVYKNFWFQAVSKTSYTHVHVKLSASNATVSVSSGTYATDALQTLTINGTTYNGTAPVTVNTAPLYITLTQDESTGEWTADHKYQEIAAQRYMYGREPVCVVDGMLVPLVGHGDSSLDFILTIAVGSGFITYLISIADDNTVYVDLMETPTGELVVNVSGDQANGYTSDLSFDEIAQMRSMGTTVVCVFNGMRLPLVVEDSELFQFAFTSSSFLTMCAITSDSVVVQEIDGSITIGESTWTGESPMDFTDTINGMIDDKIPSALPSPHKLTFTGAVTGEYDGSGDVTINIPAAGSDVETETVLSDNLFDKSIATTGKVFYHSSSGPTLADMATGFYAYVPLRGAGTYIAHIAYNVHGADYAKRVPIVKADKTFLQNVTGTLTTIDSTYGYVEFTITQAMIDSGAALYCYDNATTMLNTAMIVKDREYPSVYIPYGYIEVEVGSDNVNDKYDNILKGKTAVFLGDSLCAGTTVGDIPEYGYGWAGLIGTANKMTWKNYGKNGAVVMTTNTSTDRYIPDQADQALQEYANADYVIFDGGANDAYQTHSDSTKLGEISADYATFDLDTFSGGFEALILKLVTNFPNARIGYIVGQKLDRRMHDSTHPVRKYFDRAVEICQKWGIPYIDLWRENPLNPMLTAHFDSTLDAAGNIAAGKFYTDGEHLTLAGYQRIAPQIEAFMRSL